MGLSAERRFSSDGRGPIDARSRPDPTRAARSGGPLRRGGRTASTGSEFGTVTSVAHVSEKPIFVPNLLQDPGQVVTLLEDNAPNTPLGGWLWPGADPDAPTRPLWFQNDWVQGEIRVPGAEVFLFHEEVMATARRFYDAEVVVPHTLYVNVMGPTDRCGPAHTDNPVFAGRNRQNTPMLLLRIMYWSGLFDRWAIPQATSIWWMNDVDGGGLRYWPAGPDSAPEVFGQEMANVALVGDNHGMFHQVEPVGGLGATSPRVSGRAELAPAPDGAGDWAVVDHGQIVYRAPLEQFRVSVLWKAHVYANEDAKRRLEADPLSLEQVADRFAHDLQARGSDLRLDLDRLDDPSQFGPLAAVYPEPKPQGAQPSFFDPYP